MEKKIALVTGATSGIGRETAKQLLEQGVFVIIGARDLEKGRNNLNLLKEISTDVDMVQLDITSEESVVRAADTIDKKYGRIDILVNNAATWRDSAPISELDVNDWIYTYETNVFGTIRVTKHFLPLLKKAKEHGNIVNVSSGMGSLSSMTDASNEYFKYSMPSYSSSKAALNVYTVHLARELKPLGIKVNSVCPGYTRTEGNDAEDAQPVQEGAKAPVHYALLGKDGPTGGFFNSAGAHNW